MQNLSFVCIDFETTGLESTAEIIEIGMVKVVNGEIVDRFDSLIKPLNPIPEHITDLTGITNDMVCQQPCWGDLEDSLLTFIGDYLLVAHNVSFDRGMLEQHLGYETNNLWVDTHDMAKIFLPHLTSYKLSAIASSLDIVGNGYHRAVYDAEVTSNVLLKIIDIACQTNPFTMQKIYEIFFTEKPENGLSYLLKILNSYTIAHAQVAQTPKTIKPTIEFADHPNLFFNQVESFFEPEGLMDQHSDHYQHRPQQVGMLQTIAKAFKTKKHGIIEAGTGTGKSFAYLVPSLLWAYENNCRVVVSTNTIALQEQLYHTDTPFLKNILNFDFPVALSKGRSNYLCLRRQELYKNQIHSMIWSERIFIAQILYWLDFTIDGDKEPLNLNKMEHQFWSNISSQAETCLSIKCPYYRRCYYMSNKKQCEQSLLIITNHALLLQNLKLDGQVLPSYDHVIIDEAHNLEDEATKQFTNSLDFEFLRKYSNQLLRNNSIINRIQHKLEKTLSAGDTLTHVHQTYITLKDDIGLLEQYINIATDFIFTIPELSRNNEWRITEHERNSTWWPEFQQHTSRIEDLVTTINRRLVKIIHQLELVDDIEDLTRELTFVQSWYKEQENHISDFIQKEDSNQVYWLEYNKSSWGASLALSIAPIQIMPMLKELLFDQNESVILTSATLAISNNLKYTAQVYLLEKDEFLSFITPSPFNYQQQSFIAIPTDNPNYSQVNETVYTEMVIHNLEKIIPSVNGGILILFTSYAMLNKVYYALKRNTLLSDYNILAHGQDGSRTSIIQNLNNVKNTIVLGANSFWEGIDIKGSGLTTVVIVKLPFQPPTKPIASAKLEYLQSLGLNSFAQYSLPQAVLRFRQGCGRLIRSNTDWGAIIILDNRVINKTYGKQFIKSLPSQPVVTKPLDEICSHLTQWMNTKTTI